MEITIYAPLIEFSPMPMQFPCLRIHIPIPEMEISVLPMRIEPLRIENSCLPMKIAPSQNEFTTCKIQIDALERCNSRNNRLFPGEDVYFRKILAENGVLIFFPAGRAGFAA
jgi:hypothetical protein